MGRNVTSSIFNKKKAPIYRGFLIAFFIVFAVFVAV